MAEATMRSLAFGIFVLAVMGIPAGFVAWPVAWRFDASERVRAWARRLFVLHTVGVVSTVALADLYVRAVACGSIRDFRLL